MSEKTISKLHGMKDDRWAITDKMSQYRGLISLYTRDRKKTKYQAVHKRKKQALDLRKLKTECVKYRADLDNSLYGNRQRIRNALQEHHDKQLKYEGLLPHQVQDSLEHINTVKLKELDRLKYKRKERMKVFQNLHFELSELQDRLKVEPRYSPQRSTERALYRRLENMYVKQDAAENVKIVYQHISKILQKDSSYFDTVLSSLRADARVQCRCVIRATELGQTATEDLANTQDEYKLIEMDVKLNMKARDIAVKDLEQTVADLKFKCKMLVRTDSDVVLVKEDRRTPSELALPKQIELLQGIMKELQDVTLVSTYEDVFPRMTEQRRQQIRLLIQLEMNTRLRDELLNMKNHAELMLVSLQNAMVEITFKYQEDKNMLLETIEEETSRKTQHDDAFDTLAQTHVLLRTSLQALFELLSVVRTREEMTIEIAHSLTGREGSLVFEIPPPFESDIIRLLRLVGQKLSILSRFAAAHIKTDLRDESEEFFMREKIHEAKGVLQPDDIDGYDLALVGDNEMDDVNVLSRVEVKLRSQRMVSHFERSPFDMDPIPQIDRSGKKRGQKK